MYGKFRKEAVPEDFAWVVRALPETVFVAFDTETTGLDAKAGRVVEIGAVKFTKDCLLGTFEELMDPGMPMPKEASDINGITDAMLAGHDGAELVMPRFLAFAEGSVLVAHNAPFDIGFKNEELGRLDLSSLVNRAVDTRLLARAAFPGRSGYKLQMLAEDFRLPVESAHRALDDASVCMRLFFLCIQKIEKMLKPPQA
jgi:DNA polymerase III subunit epsilon